MEEEPKSVGAPPPSLPEVAPIGEALPAASLPVAEPHELETYGKAPSPLKIAAEALAAAARLPSDPGSLDPEFSDPSQLLEHERELAEQEARHQQAAATAKVSEQRGAGQVPAWAKVPQVGPDGQPFRFPKGRKVMFLRFHAHLTDVPGKGERQAILWPLSPGDFRFAIDRGQGNAQRTADEIALQCIRAIDGVAVDWTTGGVANNPAQFWGEIGQAYRTQLVRLANQVNSLNAGELRDFLEHCVALVITG